MSVDRNEIIRIAQIGDIDALNAYLKSCDIRQVKLGLEAAFQCACGNGDIDVVNRLLALNEPKINYQAVDEYAFRWACKNGHIKVVNRLLKLKNPPVNYRARNDDAFVEACSSGHLEVVNRLFELNNYLTDKMEVNLFTRFISYFTRTLNVTILKIDIKSNIDFAFRLACENGHIGVVNRLLKLKHPPADYSAKNEYAFRAACQYGHLAVVNRLLELKDPKVDYQADNEYAFRWACVNGHIRVVNRLLKLKKPRVNYQAHNEEAFKLACQFGHLSVVNRLLELKDTKVDYQAHNEEAFKLACQFGHLSVVNRLLELKDPKVDYQADNEYAFRWACAYGHIRVVNRLLKLKKPRVNYQAHNEEAFQWACQYGHLSVVNRLLELKDPKIDYQAYDEYAFRWACAGGHLDVVNRLLELPGTNPGVLDFQCVRSALDNGHRPVAEAVARWVHTRGTQEQRARIDVMLGQRGIVINYEQSIHAASVHASVSQSALNLFKHYGSQIEGDKLSDVLNVMKAYVNGLPSGTKSEDITGAAQRYLEGLNTNSEPNAYSRFGFIDKTSKVTTRQLLALTYLAATDEKTFLPGVKKEDALHCFVRGLYEVQRGYNLDERDVDKGGADRVICTSGAFNKAVEALSYIHQDCQIMLVTKIQAGMKLPKVVEEEVLGVLNSDLEKCLENITTSDTLRVLMDEMNQLIENGIDDTLYSRIKGKVSKRLFHEFGSLYASQESADFCALIDSIKYVSLIEAKGIHAVIARAKKALKVLEDSKPVNIDPSLQGKPNLRKRKLSTAAVPVTFSSSQSLSLSSMSTSTPDHLRTEALIIPSKIQKIETKAVVGNKKRKRHRF